MSERNAGLTADVLFVAVTRPPMRWGVTYSALLFNAVFTMEVFLLTKNLLTLLIAAPIHGICALLCARDARFFDLILLWGRTRMPAYFANYWVWKASSHGPLLFDLPNLSGRRRLSPLTYVNRPRLARYPNALVAGRGQIGEWRL
jgi:type IV secretion system protein VirB3